MTHLNIKCADCGTNFDSDRQKKRIHCSQCQFAHQKARAAALGSCDVDECSAPQFCKGMCQKHYWADRAQKAPRAPRVYTRICAWCGKESASQDRRSKHCSLACAIKTRDGWSKSTDVLPHNPEMVAGIKSLEKAIKANHRSAKAIKTGKRAPGVKADLRSPIRRAYEDGDMPGLIKAIKADTVTTTNGCWEWQRQLTREGYGRVSFGTKSHTVHRLTSMARYGQPESEPVVHHVCSNRLCCNPDHLQPISQRENMAEMLERNYYLRRIQELETALQAVDPHNATLSPLALSA